MAVTSDKPAPYAPASVIMELVERHRGKGLPSPVTTEVLARAGVSESLLARTIQALETLDLIDAEGAPTTTFEGIRKAPEGEYRQRLVEWLNAAYADVIKYVDPALDNETAVRDAFRSYNPVGQQNRMVSLFLLLYASAGVRPEKASQPRPQRNGQQRPRATNKPTVTPPARKHTSHATNPGLPPALAGLLSSLPQEGSGWTKASRDRFVTTFAAVLDFCYPVVTQAEAADQDVDDDEP
jgi:hypothetical protein